MHAYIIAAGTAEDRAKFMAAKAAGLTELIHLTAEKSSLTIKQIHALVALLTVRARLPRLVWIEEAGLLTLPAQNALLKSLEEPPADTTFYLTLSRVEHLLPTIRSRCTLIRLTPTAPTTPIHLPLVKRALPLSSGDRLLLAKELPTDRPGARAWFSQLLTELNTVMQSTSAYSSQLILLKLAESAGQAEERLGKNTSVSLTLQNFLLHLPKLKL